MTTPPTSNNRYGNTQVNGPYGYYGLGLGGQASQMLPYAFQMFPHQLTYPYLQASQPIYLSYPPPHNIRPLPLPGFGGPEMLRTRHGEDVHKPQPQKIQKRNEQSGMQIVNLVSDQEEPAQPEKPCEDRNTTSNSKPNEYNGVIKPSLPPSTKNKQKTHQKEPKDQPTLSQNRLPPKTTKSKEIVKQKHSHKKNKIRRQSCTQVTRKTTTFSQRLSEKETLKKMPFRLSKREREQLQIGELRQLKCMILTGPHFQAKLPVFQGGAPVSNRREVPLESWLKSKREELLARRCDQESDDE